MTSSVVRASALPCSHYALRLTRRLVAGTAVRGLITSVDLFSLVHLRWPTIGHYRSRQLHRMVSSWIDRESSVSSRATGSAARHSLIMMSANSHRPLKKSTQVSASINSQFIQCSLTSFGRFHLNCVPSAADESEAHCQELGEYLDSEGSESDACRRQSEMELIPRLQMQEKH